MNYLHKMKFVLNKDIYKKITLLGTLLLVTAVLFAQEVTVLPGNDNYSSQFGPQGGVRAQRQFYLIRPSEMKASGLPGGTVINRIGFVLGVAQDTSTRGAFKV